jgi:hypothetical protein
MLHFLIYCFYEIFAGSDGNERETKGLNLNWSEWDAHSEDQQVGVRDVIGLEGELLQSEQDSTWEFCNCAEETGRASNKRAHATEVAAGMAAAQVSSFCFLPAGGMITYEDNIIRFTHIFCQQ